MLDPYKRYNQRDRFKDKVELIFGITQKDLFKKELLPLNRLTGNRGTSHSMPKNKNTIIHSNSTNHMKLMKNNSKMNMKENNFNIININVNNFIINNKDIKNNANNNKVFSKIGNEIIDGKNLFNNDNKKNKVQPKMNRGKPSVSVQKKPMKEKYELSNIQSVINELMEETKSPPPSFDNNLNQNQNQIQNQNNNELNNNLKKINNLNSNANNENQLSQNIDENIMEIHFKLWEILLNMEMHSENKLGLSNQVKKIFSLMETDIIADVNNKNKNIGDIFNNNQLNLIYNKTIKIGLILSIYIKFILIDFNFELTIKSNIKRLSSLINENLLSILCSQVFIKENIQENYLCSNIRREFIDQYTRLIKLKKNKKKCKGTIK
jgi:hypothetical protein